MDTQEVQSAAVPFRLGEPIEIDDSQEGEEPMKSEKKETPCLSTAPQMVNHN